MYVYLFEIFTYFVKDFLLLFHSYPIYIYILKNRHINIYIHIYWYIYTHVHIYIQDAIYFDALLKAIKDDKKDQCKVIVKTTIMGQLVAENVDDLKQKYKLMTTDVLKNMKERERTLIITRERVADLWEYAKSLVRIEVTIRSFFCFNFLFKKYVFSFLFFF